MENFLTPILNNMLSEARLRACLKSCLMSISGASIMQLTIKKMAIIRGGPGFSDRGLSYRPA